MVDGIGIDDEDDDSVKTRRKRTGGARMNANGSDAERTTRATTTSRPPRR